MDLMILRHSLKSMRFWCGPDVLAAVESGKSTKRHLRLPTTRLRHLASCRTCGLALPPIATAFSLYDGKRT